VTSNQAPAARSRRGFLGQLFAGSFRWDLLAPFPAQDPEDFRAGAAVTAELRAFLHAHIDPEEVEASGALPRDFVAKLRTHRLLDLQTGADLGGRGLSFANVMRVLETAIAWCLPAGYVLAVHNGLGAGAVWPVIPEGKTRDYVRGHLSRGAVSGWADTEPTGAGNSNALTTATATSDGGYEISGEKIYIVNGSIADLLLVSASVNMGDRRETQVFFVDTTLPGFHVRRVHELMGLRGVPIAALSFDRVRVGPEALLVTVEPHWRDTPLLEPISALGRMYTIVAASIAVSKNCVTWGNEFLARREVDGQSLSRYDAIQRLVAENAAEVFAMQSVAFASIIGLDHDNLATRWFEQVAAKNLAALGCARIVDNTMSLFSAEGYECAPSKARHGAPAAPVERALRDARAFRIAGGIDFLVDYHAAREGLLTLYYPDAPAPPMKSGPLVEPRLVEPRLSRRNAAHLEVVAAEVQQLGRFCRELRRRYEQPLELYARQRVLILLGQIARELFAMSATLARAASIPEHPTAQALADVYCSHAHLRVRTAVTELSAEPDTGLSDSIATCTIRM
jgi:hypothetical protein